MRLQNPLQLLVLFFALGVGNGCSGGSDDGPKDDTDEQETGDTDDTDPYVAPTVSAEPTYTMIKTEGVVYAQGLIDAGWGAEDGTPIDLMLDLWEPEGTDGSLRPALVLIHGGGFTSGSRTNGAIVALCEYFAQRGWVTASISYRLAGSQGPIPANWNTVADGAGSSDQVRAMYLAARDARAAVRWVTANAEALNVDVQQVSVGGGSAGAYTAIAVGVSAPEDYRDELSAAQDSTLETTNPSAPHEVQAVLDFWGGPAIPAISEVIDGTSRFDSEDPALAIIHGTEDTTVRYEEAEKLVTRYETSGASFELFSLEGKGHSAWGASYEGQNLAELSFDFLVKHQGLQVLE